MPNHGFRIGQGRGVDRSRPSVLSAHDHASLPEAGQGGSRLGLWDLGRAGRQCVTAPRGDWREDDPLPGARARWSLHVVAHDDVGDLQGITLTGVLSRVAARWMHVRPSTRSDGAPRRHVAAGRPAWGLTGWAGHLGDGLPLTIAAHLVTTSDSAPRRSQRSPRIPPCRHR